ncbi:30S ribosomal protein S17 [Synechococcus sp. M16CYN]|uniref:30S ribosomal protein S17 n=1 Tax=Synechococcus sp. M16CYN TaxID=3103139 RepID=UPI00324DEB9F
MAVKERVGTVVSDKMEKTVVVAVETRFPHPIYQKTVSRTTRYKAHDEDNFCRIGDRVRIMETRPMSRQKHWAIAEVLSRSAKSNTADANAKGASPEVTQ